MWLVIAALLLAAAIQSIGYYQQAAYAYSAKEDVMSIQKWAAANSASTNQVPSSTNVNNALTVGDLKLTSDNSSLVASAGAKYCVGVYAPRITSTNKVFYSTSDAPSNIQRAAVMPSTCGTVTNAGTNGGTGSGSISGTGATSTPLPLVSTARLRFGVTEPLGPLSTQVDDVARLVNEYPGIVSTYKDWGSGTNSAFNQAEVDAVFNKGSQAMITWEPFDSSAADGINQSNFQLKNIYNGNYDSYISTWIQSIKATNYSKPIMLRFAHEMNGNWYPWAQQVNGNADGDYIKAWKYVHDKFTAAGVGADKVNWVWAPNIPYTGSTDFWKLYPGDAYVDTIGLDGFNYGTTESWSTWQAPWNVLGSGLWFAKHANGDANVENNKPIVITETGSAPSEGTNSQGQWASDLISWLNSDPKVTGFVWFDQIKADQLNTGGGVKNWRIDSTTDTTQHVTDSLAARRQ